MPRALSSPSSRVQPVFYQNPSRKDKAKEDGLKTLDRRVPGSRTVKSATTANTGKRIVVRAPNDQSRALISPQQWRQPSLVDCRSSALERMQIRASFSNVFYPKSRIPTTSIFRSLMLPNHLVKRNPTLAMTVDAVCLTHMGVMTSNPSAVYEGVQLYYGALSRFRETLEKAFLDRSFNTDLLETSQALIFCERFSYIGSGEVGAYIHIKALGEMLLAQGIDSFKTKFDRMLLEDFQHYTTRYGIVARRSVHPVLEAALARETFTSQGPFTRLSQLCAKVPGLLERGDKVCKDLTEGNPRVKSEALDRCATVLAEFKKMESTLEEWLEGWYRQSTDVGYRSVPQDTFEVFRREFPADLLDTFPLVFHFSSFASAIGHSRFFLALFLIRSSISAMLGVATPMQVPLKQRTHNVTDCVDELSRTLAYISGHPENGLTGFASMSVNLKMAFDWYKEIDDRKKMAWCDAMSKICESRGMYMYPLSMS